MRSVIAILCMFVIAALFPSAALAQKAARAETRVVEVNGAKIAYRSIGRGHPIVLANRLRGTLDTWDPLFLDELARSHRVITFDYPGVGYSTGTLPDDTGRVAAFIGDFATALDLDRFAILGWSWGGLAAQVFLLDYPERATHAVLLATNPPGPPDVPLQQVFLERALKPVNDLADEEVLFFEPKSEASRQAAKRSHDRIYARPGVTEKIPSRMEEFQVYFKAAEGFHQDRMGRRQALNSTRVPILIMCGDNDTSTSAVNWFPFVGKVRTAQLVVYPDSGHAPHHQYPQIAAQQLTSFLKAASVSR